MRADFGELGAWPAIVYALLVVAAGCWTKWRQVRMEKADRERIDRRITDLEEGDQNRSA